MGWLEHGHVPMLTRSAVLSTGGAPLRLNLIVELASRRSQLARRAVQALRTEQKTRRQARHTRKAERYPGQLVGSGHGA